MLWWPLFFITLLFAQEDLTVEKYCFHSQMGMEKAFAQFSGVSVPSDKALKEGTCFTITARPHRRELIQKYLLSQNPDMSISFSSEAIRKDSCELKVEKIKSSSAQDTKVEIGEMSALGVNKSNGSANETYHITTLKNFELALNQDKITGECRYITPQRYEITLVIEKEARPYIPPVPVGTIIVINTPPPDQQTSILKTQIQLNRDSKVEIGSIVQDMRDKDHSINTKEKIEVSDRDKTVQEKVFLSIN